MPKRMNECVVCGRKFPEGQGIVIRRGGITLYFHSSRCAAKFLRILIENADECVIKSLKDTVDQFKKIIDARRKASEKTI